MILGCACIIYGIFIGVVGIGPEGLGQFTGERHRSGHLINRCFLLLSKFEDCGAILESEALLCDWLPTASDCSLWHR